MNETIELILWFGGGFIIGYGLMTWYILTHQEQIQQFLKKYLP
jgi:hypothetical protein